MQLVLEVYDKWGVLSVHLRAAVGTYPTRPVHNAGA